jgi:hypothetical protein
MIDFVKIINSAQVGTVLLVIAFLLLFIAFKDKLVKRKTR